VAHALVNHLRFVLLELPTGYADFIHRRLQPGGTVCFLECGAKWLQYRVGEHSTFQVGGWGDVAPDEYISGSPRVQRYCQAAGLTNSDWRLPGYPSKLPPNLNGEPNRALVRRWNTFVIKLDIALSASRYRSRMIFHAWHFMPLLSSWLATAKNQPGFNRNV